MYRLPRSLTTLSTGGCILQSNTSSSRLQSLQLSWRPGLAGHSQASAGKRSHNLVLRCMQWDKAAWVGWGVSLKELGTSLSSVVH